MLQRSIMRFMPAKIIPPLFFALFLLVSTENAAFAQCDGSSVKNAHMQAWGDRTTTVTGPTMQNRQVTMAQFNSPAAAQGVLNQNGPNADPKSIYFPQGAPGMNNIIGMVGTAMSALTGATGLLGGLMNSVTTLFSSLGGLMAGGGGGGGCPSPTITQADYRV